MSTKDNKPPGKSNNETNNPDKAETSNSGDFSITKKISKHFKKYLGNKKPESWLMKKIRKSGGKK